MTGYIWTNNASSLLASSIGTGDTSLSVTPGSGGQFPAPSGGDYAAITLVSADGLTIEIVRLTSRSGDVLTVTRAQEGTSAAAFSAGAVVSHRLTAAQLDYLKTIASSISGAVLLSPASGSEQTIQPGQASDRGLIVKGRTAQTASLQEWQNVSGTAVATMAADGGLTVAGAFQGLRVAATQAGTEAVPAIALSGTDGFRLNGTDMSVVVENKDAAVFEIELVDVGDLSDLSVITKRVGDLLYFPISGGSFTAGIEVRSPSAYLDFADSDGAAYPGYNVVRWKNDATSFDLDLRDNTKAALADIIKIPYGASGATGVGFYISGTIAGNFAAAGASAPNTYTVMTREKADARYTAIAHASNTSNPHSVTASQVAYDGAEANVNAALLALEALPAGGVQSVFGRAGTVVAADADYSAAQVAVTPGGSLVSTRVQAALLEIDSRITGLPAGGVQSVFGRTGAVAANAADYSAHYLQVSNKASQAEAEAGADDTKYMTPLKTAEAIAVQTTSLRPLFHARDEKSSGSIGGTFGSGAWRTRTLNTVVGTNEIAGVSLASDQITLPDGVYEFEAHAPANNVRTHKLRLQNITDAITVLVGSSEDSSANNLTTRSFVSGKFTVAGGPKLFELQHRCENTQASTGLGTACGFGVVEVYASIRIWKAA